MRAHLVLVLRPRSVVRDSGRKTNLLTGEVRGELVQGDVLQEVGGERERGEVLEDEAVHKDVQPLQAVEESQLLQVQVVVRANLHLQVLAAEVHRLPDLDTFGLT